MQTAFYNIQALRVRTGKDGEDIPSISRNTTSAFMRLKLGEALP